MVVVDFSRQEELQALVSEIDSKIWKSTVSALMNWLFLVVPPPDTYNLPSDFHGAASLNNPAVVSPHIAFTFGISREAYKKVYSPLKNGQGNEDPSIPGPGAYNPP